MQRTRMQCSALGTSAAQWSAADCERRSGQSGAVAEKQRSQHAKWKWVASGSSLATNLLCRAPRPLELGPIIVLLVSLIFIHI